MSNVPWSKEDIARAADLWKAGQSISQIGTVFGVSRSSMAGIMNRNRDLFPKSNTVGVKRKKNESARTFPLPEKREVRSRKADPKTPRSTRKLDAPILGEVWARADIDQPVTTVEPKTFFDLHANECTWFLQKMDEPATHETLCCAARVQPGTRYCPEHRKRMYAVR